MNEGRTGDPPCRQVSILDTDGYRVPRPCPAEGTLSRLWRWRRRPSGTITVLTLPVVGFASGVVFRGGFNTVVEATNTEEFCISCHELRDNVCAGYKKTIHYSNRTGVRAVCARLPADGHVAEARVMKGGSGLVLRRNRRARPGFRRRRGRKP
ncbi:MAG: NapC/NirT family cytochrome c [Burkholderiales bacterium]|nr:NapC/NirT family cytochrome c [Burkholderiales bacterium]